MLRIHDVPTCSALEPNIFKQYFFDRVQQLVGLKEAGRRFVAITDPGSKLQQVAERDRVSTRVATCLEFGPRFLRSTAQAYKGAPPNTGVLLQITCDDAIDLPVPGQKYTFGVVKAAQARA